MATQTQTFPCPFCGRRMGVGIELLGKHVRCPHCKQVVLAPTATNTPAAQPGAPAPATPTPNATVSPLATKPTPAPIPAPIPAAPPPASPPNVATPPTPVPPSESEQVIKFPHKEAADSILSDEEESEDEVFPSPGTSKVQVPLFPEIPPPASPPPVQPSPMLPHVVGPVPTSPPPAATAPVDPFSFDSAPPAAAPKATSPPSSLDLPSSEVPTVELRKPMQVYHQPPAVPSPTTPTPVVPQAPVPSANPFAFDSSPVIAAPTPAAQPLAPQKAASESLPLDEAPADAAKPARPGRSRVAASGTSGVSKVALYVLAGYALLMTVLAVYGFFFKGGGVDSGHPLSTIPDSFGEFDPVSRKKVTQYRFPVDGELPANLRAGLGGKIEVGQLAIEPLKIETRPLHVITETPREKRDETKPQQALVMHLRVKNTSDDLAIFPMDPALTRRARLDDKQPATRLVVGKQVFYGGGIDWPFPVNVTRRYEEQQVNDASPLKPGETREYVVFTDADPRIVKAVQDSSDPMLWRVQVRRGLIEYRGKDVPVTAIIGVEFKASDVKPAS